MKIRRILFRCPDMCFAVLFLFCSISQAIAADVSLAWDPSTSPTISGYKLHIGNAFRTYNASITLGNQTAYTVSGLEAGRWHFAVTAFDHDGNKSDFSNEVWTVVSADGEGAPALVFPRFSAGQNTLGSDSMSGIGLVNVASGPTSVTFTAVDDDGSLTAGQDFVNHVQANLNGMQQLPIVDSQIFGNGIFDLKSNGYIKLNRTNKETSGFFLIFDGDLNFQDGANLSDIPLTDFAFTEIQADGYNKISIINDNPEDVDLTIDLVSADGKIRSSISRKIAAYGSLTADLFGDLFIGNQAYADDYVRVKSSAGVHSFQVMKQKSGDMAMLAGQDLTTGGTALYSPLYAMGESYRTSFSLINLDSKPGTASLRLFNQNGSQIGSSREVAISANGKIYIDDPGFFANLNLNVLNTGYLEIIGNGIRLIGSTAMFGDINTNRWSFLNALFGEININSESFLAALKLVSNPQKNVLFGHVASNDIYFTGISILNPNPTLARVGLFLYEADGTLREFVCEVIGPKQRQSRLLSQYFASLAGQNQTSGYVALLSDVPIVSFAMFGKHDLSLISAIPPQIIR